MSCVRPWRIQNTVTITQTDKELRPKVVCETRYQRRCDDITQVEYKQPTLNTATHTPHGTSVRHANSLCFLLPRRKGPRTRELVNEELFVKEGMELGNSAFRIVMGDHRTRNVNLGNKRDESEPPKTPRARRTQSSPPEKLTLLPEVPTPKISVPVCVPEMVNRLAIRLPRNEDKQQQKESATESRGRADTASPAERRGGGRKSLP
jgi:hypothetical protein